MKRYYQTSEAVTSGHPDKICDQIADAVVDYVIGQDAYCRCGIEVLVNDIMVIVSGELRTPKSEMIPEIDIAQIVHSVLNDIGYANPDYGFTYDNCSIIKRLRLQSEEIAAVLDGVKKDMVAAPDQGLMIGYATNETQELMPLPILLSNKLVKELDYLRKTKIIPYLRPDGKAQVTVEYDNHLPKHISSIVIAAQHNPEIEINQIRNDISSKLICKLPTTLITDKTRIVINNLGRFVTGGPAIDTGVTGRKIVTDTYGGVISVGGGALSGKDPSKLDRTGTYYARYVAKNIVAAGLANKCKIEIAYAFGVTDPVSINIDAFDTFNVPETEIIRRVNKVFNFKPEAMIEQLSLRQPIYRPTATYGVFGWQNYPWEAVDKINELQN